MNIRSLVFFIFFGCPLRAASEQIANVERFKEHIQVFRELVPLLNNTKPYLPVDAKSSKLVSTYTSSSVSGNRQEMLYLVHSVNNWKNYLKTLSHVDKDTLSSSSSSSTFGSLRGTVHPLENGGMSTSDLVKIDDTHISTSQQVQEVTKLQPVWITVHMTSTVKVNETVTQYLPTTVSLSSESTSTGDSKTTYSPSNSVVSGNELRTINATLTTLLASQVFYATPASEVKSVASSSISTSMITSTASYTRRQSNVKEILNNKNPSNNKIFVKPQFKFHVEVHEAKSVLPYAKPKVPLIGALHKKNSENATLSLNDPTSSISPTLVSTVADFLSPTVLAKSTSVLPSLATSNGIVSLQETSGTSSMISPITSLIKPATSVPDSIPQIQTFHIEDSKYIYDFIIENGELQVSSAPKSDVLLQNKTSIPPQHKGQFDILHVPPSIQKTRMTVPTTSDRSALTSSLLPKTSDSITTEKTQDKEYIESLLPQNKKKPTFKDEWDEYYVSREMDMDMDMDMDATQNIFRDIYGEDDYDFDFGYIKNDATGFMRSNAVLVMIVAMVALWL